MITKWYTSIPIPTFNQTEKIEKFVKNAMGIALTIVKDKLNLDRIKIFVDDVETAAVDLSNMHIYISRKYIDPLPKNRINPSASEEESLSAMLGSTIHELLHVHYTRIPIEMIAELAGLKLEEINELALSINQIVEDVYIDNAGRSLTKSLSWATSTRLNYLFPLEKRDEAYDKITNKIESFDDLITYVSALYYLKNFNLLPYIRRALPDLFTKIQAMVISSRNIHKVENRLLHSIKIADLLLNELKSSECEKTEVDANGDEAESSSGSSDGKNEENSSKEKAKNDKGNAGESGKEFTEEQSEALSKIFANSNTVITVSQKNSDKSQKLEIENADINIELNKKNQDVGDSYSMLEITPSEESFLNFGFVEYNESFVKELFGKLIIDERFFDFSTLMVARSQSNRPYGLQSNRGSNIRQLYRIATDDKIFAPRVEFDHIGPQEIVILVDMSGSMSTNDKIIKALNAAFGAAVGLQNARHRVAVFGHTADWTIGEKSINVVIMKLKDFDEDANVVILPRMQDALKFSGVLDSNSDDYAILTIMNKFSEIRNQKSLIVISDGKPLGEITQGSIGTQRAVNLVRDNGVKVVSISIEKSAVETNDFIYGKENNFDSSDPGIVFNVIEKITN